MCSRSWSSFSPSEFFILSERIFLLPCGRCFSLTPEPHYTAREKWSPPRTPLPGILVSQMQPGSFCSVPSLARWGCHEAYLPFCSNETSFYQLFFLRSSLVFFLVLLTLLYLFFLGPALCDGLKASNSPGFANLLYLRRSFDLGSSLTYGNSTPPK